MFKSVSLNKYPQKYTSGLHRLLSTI
jgi:hypothetical protein